METETNNSGHKTKKAKQKKKRARNNSTSSMAVHGSHVKSNKKQKVPKTKTEKGSSRKLKALGLLCARFIIMHYKDVPDSTEIKLSNLSEEMGIERRRMYDCSSTEAEYSKYGKVQDKDCSVQGNGRTAGGNWRNSVYKVERYKEEMDHFFSSFFDTFNIGPIFIVLIMFI